MRLDYFTLLCPEPISLSIGTIKQPTLRSIGKLTFHKYCMYQVYLKLTPKDYYEIINKKQGEKVWQVLSDEQKQEISLFDVILVDDIVRYMYLEILNFFFIERVIFRDNVFLIIDTNDYDVLPEEIEITKDNIRGMITSNTILDVLDVLQQVCCIKSNDPMDEAKPKFKNAKAKRLYEKMLKAKDADNKKRELKDVLNLTLPNIISATAAKNSGLNIVNIWDATLFQLYDQFGKTQNDDAHYLNTVRVAVWGDEKDQFDPSLWYKNTYDKHTIKDS